MKREKRDNGYALRSIIAVCSRQILSVIVNIASGPQLETSPEKRGQIQKSREIDEDATTNIKFVRSVETHKQKVNKIRLQRSSFVLSPNAADNGYALSSPKRHQPFLSLIFQTNYITACPLPLRQHNNAPTGRIRPQTTSTTNTSPCETRSCMGHSYQRCHFILRIHLQTAISHRNIEKT
ncbi:hypothetical protein Tcan_06590 [Toxocara canis]|uniref:Uncharacterized protein n=1 Tax=Toxocara canis TaxID=6265 RepID=A0A0B2V0A6_TOXCA|nr:hypothetical protein Tcan_06590 [Toxocara canis]